MNQNQQWRNQNQNINSPLFNNQNDNLSNSHQNIGNITSEQQEKINQIKEFYSIDENKIIEILKKYNWNSDEALNYIMDHT